MSIISVKDLLEAGVHFGHRVSRWNPKMAPYIFGKRNLIHIINLRETVRGLIKGYRFLNRLAAEGEEVIFIGTKRQAKSVIKREAQRCFMPFVAERWLGGTLTNFTTIRKRLFRLEELEAVEKSGSMEGMSKKMVATIRREMNKINRNLEGVRKMDKLPAAIIIVDPKKEYIALKEASRLGIPTVCLIDTDSDPDLVDIPIPGNDDAMRSIEVICAKLADALLDGHLQWEERKKAEKKIKDDQQAADAALHGSSSQGGMHSKADDEGDWDGSRLRSKKAAVLSTGLDRNKPKKPDMHGGPRDNRRPPSSGGGGGGGPRRDFNRRPRFEDKSREPGFVKKDAPASSEPGAVKLPDPKLPDPKQPPQA